MFEKKKNVRVNQLASHHADRGRALAEHAGGARQAAAVAALRLAVAAQGGAQGMGGATAAEDAERRNLLVNLALPSG